MHIFGPRTTRLSARDLQDWSFDLLKQLFWGAVVFFVVASFVNKDKLSQSDTATPPASTSQSPTAHGNEKPTAKMATRQ